MHKGEISGRYVSHHDRERVRRQSLSKGPKGKWPGKDHGRKLMSKKSGKELWRLKRRYTKRMARVQIFKMGRSGQRKAESEGGREAAR